MTDIKTTIAPRELPEALLRAVRRTDMRLCGRTLSSTDRYATAIGEELAKEALWASVPAMYAALCAVQSWWETSESLENFPNDVVDAALRQADA